MVEKEITLQQENLNEQKIEIAVESAGYEKGYTEGKADGEIIGYKKGYNEGESDGFQKGYDEGKLGGGNYEFNQIPEAVRSFLENVTYDPNDYSVSSIEDYAPATADISNTYPVGVSVEVSEGVLERKGYEIPVTAGTQTLVNDIPNRYTEYVVRNNGVVSQVGTIKPTGALRQIKCDTRNVRDLGGWACDGGIVKYGKLFRGGAILPNDIDIFVNQLGIRHELDLRGLTEAGNRTVSILGSEIGYTCTNDYNWYTLTGIEDWKITLRCIFDAISKNEPVYFHCSAGADRTGTVACIVEAILGMSQSDIDKDYELTCFYTGVGTDTDVRRRNEGEWSGLINSINNLTVGANFRDKVINWVASLGFTVDEINAFRGAMIEGTPDIITLDIDEYTVTNTLSNAATDNETTTATQYQPYEAEINVPSGYVIEDVSITMGGKDITASVFSGARANLNRAVIKNLTNCTIDNSKVAVIDGQGYGATITADFGYTLDGAEITITMGGVDVSTFFSNGKITIPSVTGDIEITVSAISSAPAYTNLADPTPPDEGGEWQTGKRYNSNGVLTNASGYSITNLLDISIKKLHIKGMPLLSGDNGGYNRFYVYNETKGYKGYLYTHLPDNAASIYNYISVAEYDKDVLIIDIEALVKTEMFTDLEKTSKVAYFSLGGLCPDANAVIITADENIE